MSAHSQPRPEQSRLQCHVPRQMHTGRRFRMWFAPGNARAFFVLILLMSATSYTVSLEAGQFSPLDSSKSAAPEPEPAPARLLQLLEREAPIVSQSVSGRGISLKAERAFEHMTVSLVTPDGQHFT